MDDPDFIPLSGNDMKALGLAAVLIGVLMLALACLAVAGLCLLAVAVLT
jgi:hypothetical protein